MIELGVRQRLGVDWLREHVRPTDCGGTFAWEGIDRWIEANHVKFAPAHWTRFLDDVRKRGVARPVILYAHPNGLSLTNGHHRIWAANKVGRLDVPAIAYDVYRRSPLRAPVNHAMLTV